MTDIDGTGERILIPGIHPAALLRSSGTSIGGSHTPDMAYVNLTYDFAKIDALARGKDVRLKLEEQLSAYNDKQHFAEAIISDRAFGNSICAESPWSFWRTFRNDFLKGMQKQIDVSQRPYPEFKAAQAANKNLSDSMMAPAIQASNEACTRNQALSRTIRVLNAIQSEPSLLTADQIDLSRLGLPTDATIDPFTEQPLVIRKQGASWLVYSLGFNLKDDGGEVDEGKDVGIAPLK